MDRDVQPPQQGGAGGQRRRLARQIGEDDLRDIPGPMHIATQLAQRRAIDEVDMPAEDDSPLALTTGSLLRAENRQRW